MITQDIFTDTRQTIADKYFDGFKEYAKGNMGIIALLSDVQQGCENSAQIINDIKIVLIADHKAGVL